MPLECEIRFIAANVASDRIPKKGSPCYKDGNRNLKLDLLKILLTFILAYLSVEPTESLTLLFPDKPIYPEETCNSEDSKGKILAELDL